MKYILIDTNNWAELLTSDQDSKLLDLLDYWVKQNVVTLLIPNILKNTEWERVKGGYLNDIKKTHEKTIGLAKSKNDPLSAFVKESFTDFENKILRIQELLEAGRSFGHSNAVKASVMDRWMQRKAPFHNNAKSNSDGLLYYSTIEYLRKRKIKEFVFVSANSNDFSDPVDKLQLHPDLQVDGISIIYFTKIGFAIHVLKEQLPQLVYSTQSGDKDYISQFFLSNKIREMPLIDQLHTALDMYYDQIPFIPLDILKRVFPFRIFTKTYFYSEYNIYTLSTNNKEIVDFFKSVRIGKRNTLTVTDPKYTKGVKNIKAKLQEIFFKLNDNLVSGILEFSSGVDPVNIQVHESRECHCVRCSFKRLDFVSSLSNLKNEPSTDISETCKNAFIHFQFGNFTVSFRLFYDVYKKCLSGDKNILSFICLYNLKKLGNLINAYGVDKDEKLIKLITEIENISSDQEVLFYKDKSDFVQENIKWIKSEMFYYETVTRITEIVEKIRQHYQSQLRGGWSNNSNLRSLVCTFDEIDNFIEKNYVIFSQSEIELIYEQVFQGLLMSYKFDSKQGSKLLHFNEYLLLKAIAFGRPEKIYQYVRDYSVSQLKYVKGDLKSWRIETIILRYFTSYPEMQELIKKRIESEAYFFYHRLHRTTVNLINVAALCNIDKKLVTPILQAIIIACKQDKIVRQTEQKYFSAFVFRQGKNIEANVLNELLQLAIEDEQFHDEAIFASLKNVILKYHPSLIITESEIYQKIIEVFFHECPKCNRLHRSSILPELYFILKEEFQNDLSRKISEKLKVEFDMDVYYIYAIYDIIDYKDLLSVYLKRFDNPPKELKEVRSPFSHGEAVMRRFSELLNLAFKFNISMNNSLFEAYRGVSSYYDWLLNLDEFDYKKFKPEWIIEYATKYYLKRIFASKKVRRAVKEYLRENKHPQLMDVFIEYT